MKAASSAGNSPKQVIIANLREDENNRCAAGESILNPVSPLPSDQALAFAGMIQDIRLAAASEDASTAATGTLKPFTKVVLGGTLADSEEGESLVKKILHLKGKVQKSVSTHVSHIIVKREEVGQLRYTALFKHARKDGVKIFDASVVDAVFTSQGQAVEESAYVIANKQIGAAQPRAQMRIIAEWCKDRWSATRCAAFTEM